MPDGRRVVEELRVAAQAGLHRVGAHRTAWRLGLAEERAFWDEYLATGGLHWPEEHADRLDPDRALPPAVVELIDAATDDPVRLLDVGSGPLSAFAGRVPGREVDLVAVDPLADWYAELYRRHGVTPLVRPQAGRIEDLADVVPRDHFDVVAARNALDHSADPVRGVGQMLAVARPGGWVHLEHAEREGATRRYRGLHHWDLWAEGGRLLVGHRDGHADLAEAVGVDEVRAETDEWGWVRATLRRAA